MTAMQRCNAKVEIWMDVPSSKFVLWEAGSPHTTEAVFGYLLACVCVCARARTCAPQLVGWRALCVCLDLFCPSWSSSHACSWGLFERACHVPVISKKGSAP